ncbi:MAG: anaerobic glycerol-3-phosphate dehydrogenase subunit C [Chloroflexi bacterium]|nr:anaerobic glycerol-3-phosphate dehydrogenase subunit C [Chloroflexota bacterium]
MDGIPPIRVMEPSGKGARRQFSKALLGHTTELDLKSIKSRLREIRESSLMEQASIVEQFKDAVAKFQGADCRWARDGAEAVNYISRIAPGTKDIVINRSSLVINELQPGLEKLGFRIGEPYYAGLGSFDNRIEDYWDLPHLLARGLMGNFEISNGPTTSQGEGTTKDCVALLGVSAASAEDSSIFFLQHSSNISKSLEQARHVILIVGLDKIVKSREDAVFQTGCMGIFGLESMLLNLKPGQRNGDGMDSLPDYLGHPDRAVHVVLLDNGRSRMLSSTFRELLLCIGCKACVRQCPINHSMTRDGAVWSPRDHLFTFLLGQNPLMDTCLHCETCRVECPLSIDLPSLMWQAQADWAAKHGRSLRDRILGNPEALARVGSVAAPVSNAVINVDPGRTIIKAGLSLDARRQLPRFGRETFQHWFARQSGRSPKTAAHRKVACYVGCFANYYRPEVAQAMVRVLERNGVEVLIPRQKCCGMPMMANKNRRAFHRNAEYNIHSLAAMIADGCDIVATCPSCALMIKREYPGLCDSDMARLVSSHTYYVDEYLMHLKREGHLNSDMAEIAQSAFYHLPCHLKVQDSAGDSLELMHLIPGLSISRVNANCCGMAGYHGYKKEYSDLAMEIGGKLFTEIRMARADRVITSCAACQLQIEAGTGIKATHPVQMLEEAYGLKA